MTAHNTGNTTQSVSHISEEQMQDKLRRIYARNPEASLLGKFARHLLDPAKPYDLSPENEKRRTHLHPLLIPLAGVALFMISVFLYFAFWR